MCVEEEKEEVSLLYCWLYIYFYVFFLIEHLSPFFSHIQALIAYLLTALSVLGVSKKYCQKGTDALLKSRAKTSNARAPHDVLRREAVLDEHAITQNGMRRVSPLCSNLMRSKLATVIVLEVQRLK